MKAVIPAAGFGTRFLPATKSQPKEMLPVYDKPTLQFLVEEAVSSGIDDILIITGRNKRSIEDHFDKSYELEYTLQRAGKDRYLKEIRKITDLADICYVRQKDLRGLGDAIRCSEKHVDNEAFAVLLGHTITKSAVPCTRQLINAYEKYNSLRHWETFLNTTRTSTTYLMQKSWKTTFIKLKGLPKARKTKRHR